jgi:hypothetical protein
VLARLRAESHRICHANTAPNPLLNHSALAIRQDRHHQPRM